MKGSFFLIFGLLPTVLLPLETVASEGTVNFTSAGAGVNAPVFNNLTGARVTAADGLLAGLYYAADGETNEGLYSYASSAGFAPGAAAGYFVGGTRVLPGTTPDTYAMAQVRVWETNYGASYEAAVTAPAQNGRKAIVGKSNVVRVQLGGAARPPNGLVGLQGFWVDIVGGGPLLSINDIIVAEGSNGVVSAVFTVSLAGPQTQSVTVDYTTQDGSALAGQDYAATNGTLTFVPGETMHTITMTVTADASLESEEDFFIALSNPTNANLRKNLGVCLITEARIDEISVDTAVTFHTVPGRHYAVEVSTDLTTWVAVSAAADVIAIGDTTTVYDKGAGCSGGRYYRTRLLLP